MSILECISKEMQLKIEQVKTTVELLEGDNTIPFIARYRKEATGNLDEVQVSQIQDRFTYLREMEERREAILQSIKSQEKLTPELEAGIRAAETKQQLEDLYLPYKPKRRTKATIAKEMGLEPLAHLLIEVQTSKSVVSEWIETFNESQETALTEDEALQGARNILAEWASEDAEIREKLRTLTYKKGTLTSKVKSEYEGKTSKFEMYYDFDEPLRDIPPHRYLALRRGEKENILRVGIEMLEEHALEVLRRKWRSTIHADMQPQIELVYQDAYSRLLAPAIETDIRLELKTQSDEVSIDLFSKNLRQLLLQPPGKPGVVLGIDPGFRSGSKWVIIDTTGKFLDNGVIYPVPPQNRVEEAQKILQGLIKTYNVDVIGIGNGTASREVYQVVKNLLKTIERPVESLMVNESGASVYSASEIARSEFPDLDLTVRGAISIARRYLDPLAELVKIDPKSIGVGQYQHDVNQTRLKSSLDRTVESCVNYVGVDLNRASAPLLSYVSGITKSMAERIIVHRNEHGQFQTRETLKEVSGLGKKTFEQAAGFLRILAGSHPLDRSAVHPENYRLVERMAADLEMSVEQLIGNESAVSKLDLKKYEEEGVGEFTLKDIIEELRKPGRDPRSDHTSVQFDDAVQEIGDLKSGMKLNGVVTNVTHFGAFVDIGVHQDGLIHISEMSNKFIKDPLEACSVGQQVVVYVKDIDTERKRIALSMKSQGEVQSELIKPKKKKVKNSPPPKKNDFNTDLSQLMSKFNT